MKKPYYLIFLVIILISGTAFAERIKYQDTIFDTAGKPVTDATIYVYAQGTSTKATLYSTATGVSLLNPVASDGYGYFWFYVEGGRYDLIVSKTGFAPRSRTDVWVGGGSGSGGSMTYPLVTDNFVVRQ